MFTRALNITLPSLSVPNVRDLVYLVKDISAESIRASSQFSINSAAKQVRMNHYLDSTYGWTPHFDDLAPWVQFDMEEVVTVWGVVVRLPGINPYIYERIRSLKVAMSEYAVKWRDASDVIITSYNTDDMLSISWFRKAATAQYWRINALTWQDQISMKADLIGHVCVQSSQTSCLFSSN